MASNAPNATKVVRVLVGLRRTPLPGVEGRLPEAPQLARTVLPCSHSSRLCKVFSLRRIRGTRWFLLLFVFGRLLTATLSLVACCSPVPVLRVFAVGRLRRASYTQGGPDVQDSLAEWSKALAPGASPQGRGFEPHSCQVGTWVAPQLLP